MSIAWTTTDETPSVPPMTNSVCSSAESMQPIGARIGIVVTTAPLSPSATTTTSF
ncbi:MAG: hypothetical protein U0802_25990 [Candidatus Binatia bacterium]